MVISGGICDPFIITLVAPTLPEDCSYYNCGNDGELPSPLESLLINTGSCGGMIPYTVTFPELFNDTPVFSNTDPEDPNVYLQIYESGDYTIEIRYNYNYTTLTPCPGGTFDLAEYVVKITNPCGEEYTISFYWPYPLC